MTKTLVVVGAGGFGREVLDVVEAINGAAANHIWTVLGVVDDDPSSLNRSRLEARGVRPLGSLAEVDQGAGVHFAVGVGSPQARARIVQQLESWGRQSPVLVHPTAAIGSQVTMGPGTIVCAQATVGTNVALGRHVHLNAHTVIGHDTQIGDHVSINPNATVSGECRIGPRTLVGASSVVLQGLNVGSDAIVGAAACVVRDVDPGRTVKGVPAE